jgi:aminopeptidase YwaD
MADHSPDDTLAARIDEQVVTLCASGDRHPGDPGNDAAVDRLAEWMGSLGLDVERLGFDVPRWVHGAANVRVGEAAFVAHPSPFSPPCEGAGRLVAASDPAELARMDAQGALLVLHGEIARIQFTPRGYPWYSDPDHTAILDALEALSPLAVICATGKNPAMTAALSPFPLIEDPSFAIPSCYLHEDAARPLVAAAGSPAHVSIDSGTEPATGTQLVGRLAGPGTARIVVAAHMDTKPDTPGALDNAGGVATMLAVAELLAGHIGYAGPAVEFVPFNGEDHALAPGEVAYLAARPDTADLRLMVNIDGAGLRGEPTAVSVYGGDEELSRLVHGLSADHPSVVEGPQWPASDHMVFAMRGVPALALTTRDFEVFAGTYAHTEADVPALVDPLLLARTAVFVARLIERLALTV